MGYFIGLSICLDPGKMELWKDGIVGFLKEIILFQFYRLTFGEPLSQHASIPNPIFQYSTVPSFQNGRSA